MSGNTPKMRFFYYFLLNIEILPKIENTTFTTAERKNSRK